MYASKVNGSTLSGESVSSAFDFILISSTVNFLQNGVTSGGVTGTANSQAVLDKLIEIVSLRGQPVIIGTVAYDGTTNYTVRVAIDHAGSWPNAVPALGGVGGAIALHGIDFGLTASNTTVTFTSTI